MSRWNSQNKPIIKNCLNCKQGFLVKISAVSVGRGKYCSNDCRFIHKYPRQEVKCLKCGETFIKSVAYIQSQGMVKYCSKSCSASSTANATGHRFTKEQKERLSKAHLGQTAWNTGLKLPKFSGENHPRWKGGYENKKLLNNQRRMQKMRLGGSYILEQWQELKAKYGFMCLCCKKSEPEITLSVDHIIPVTKWNAWIQFHPEIKYQCNDIENIQPLCRSCNSRKNDEIKDYRFTKIVIGEIVRP